MCETVCCDAADIDEFVNDFVNLGISPFGFLERSLVLIISLIPLNIYSLYS